MNRYVFEAKFRKTIEADDYAEAQDHFYDLLGEVGRRDFEITCGQSYPVEIEE